ncbi:hypothetical protein E2C01_017311 [Portunus trituberculatus]|uniref:Uncharacterized protein n=1 Tax=Portunus trituberculatus TaxID=210409 RepID=A0A5B7DT18_PORTR|nr:hypothetical protein [Portunus trituberculatus]
MREGSLTLLNTKTKGYEPSEAVAVFLGGLSDLGQHEIGDGVGELGGHGQQPSGTHENTPLLTTAPSGPSGLPCWDTKMPLLVFTSRLYLPSSWRSKSCCRISASSLDPTEA